MRYNRERGRLVSIGFLSDEEKVEYEGVWVVGQSRGDWSRRVSLVCTAIVGFSGKKKGPGGPVWASTGEDSIPASQRPLQRYHGARDLGRAVEALYVGLGLQELGP